MNFLELQSHPDSCLSRLHGEGFRGHWTPTFLPLCRVGESLRREYPWQLSERLLARRGGRRWRKYRTQSPQFIHSSRPPCEMITKFQIPQKFFSRLRNGNEKELIFLFSSIAVSTVCLTAVYFHCGKVEVKNVPIQRIRQDNLHQCSIHVFDAL